MLGPCFVVVSIYTVLCCCVGSLVRSRPWLALAGVASAAMAIISAVGALLLTGFGMTSVAYSMPFIVFCEWRNCLSSLRASSSSLLFIAPASSTLCIPYPFPSSLSLSPPPLGVCLWPTLESPSKHRLFRSSETKQSREHIFHYCSGDFVQQQ